MNIEKKDIQFLSKELIDYIQNNDEPTYKTNNGEEVSQVILKVNNSLGLWEIRNQISKLYERDSYEFEGWNESYDQPYKNEVQDLPREFQSDFKTTNKNVHNNLQQIEKNDSDFYYKLGFIYIDVINNVNNKNYQTSVNNRQKQLFTFVENSNLNYKNHINSVTNNVKNKIYPDFITILGIFTAITFAIFGGMNLLTDLFKNIGSSTTSLGQTLIIAAVFGLIMWGIIELLFYWISKIKGTTNSTKDKNKKWFNWIAFIILTFLLIVGVWLFIL